MRPLQVLVVIGATAVAAAAPAQEPISIRLLDVPADHQALKPLPTNWPPPVNTYWYRTTRYTPSATRSNFSIGSAIPRLRELRGAPLSIESLRNLVAPSPTPPTDAVPPAVAPPAADPGRPGDDAP